MHAWWMGSYLMDWCMLDGIAPAWWLDGYMLDGY